jgi:hypothetical protein
VYTAAALAPDGMKIIHFNLSIETSDLYKLNLQKESKSLLRVLGDIGNFKNDFEIKMESLFTYYHVTRRLDLKKISSKWSVL